MYLSLYRHPYITSNSKFEFLLQNYTMAHLTPCDYHHPATNKSTNRLPAVLLGVILRERPDAVLLLLLLCAVCWQRRNKGEAVSTNSAQRQETWYSSSRHGLNLEGGRVCVCVCVCPWVWYQQRRTSSPAGHAGRSAQVCAHACVTLSLALFPCYSTSAQPLIILG